MYKLEDSKWKTLEDGDFAELEDKKVVAIDFDGVITSPHRQKAEAMTDAGYETKPKESSRDYATKVKGVPLDIYEEATYSVNIDNLIDVDMEEGVKEVLSELDGNSDVALVVVTSRRDHELESVLGYITHNKLPLHYVLHTNRAHKVDAIKRLNPKIFIEDTISKINPLIEDEVIKQRIETGEFNILYFQNHANIYEESNKYVQDVDSWKEIKEKIIDDLL